MEILSPSTVKHDRAARRARWIGRVLFALALGLVPAERALAEPVASAPAEPGADRPPAGARRAAQGLAIVAVALVSGGVGSFVGALSAYGSVRDGCGASAGCTADELRPGKLALDFGWGLTSAGVAAGIGALIAAAVDGRAPPGSARAALPVLIPIADPRVGGIALRVAF